MPPVRSVQKSKLTKQRLTQSQTKKAAKLLFVSCQTKNWKRVVDQRESEISRWSMLTQRERNQRPKPPFIVAPTEEQIKAGWDALSEEFDDFKTKFAVAAKWMRRQGAAFSNKLLRDDEFSVRRAKILEDLEALFRDCGAHFAIVWGSACRDDKDYSYSATSFADRELEAAVAALRTSMLETLQEGSDNAESTGLSEPFVSARLTDTMRSQLREITNDILSPYAYGNELLQVHWERNARQSAYYTIRNMPPATGVAAEDQPSHMLKERLQLYLNSTPEWEVVPKIPNDPQFWKVPSFISDMETGDDHLFFPLREPVDSGDNGFIIKYSSGIAASDSACVKS